MAKLNIIVPKQKKKTYSYKEECAKFDAMYGNIYSGKSSLKEDTAPVLSNPFMEGCNE